MYLARAFAMPRKVVDELMKHPKTTPEGEEYIEVNPDEIRKLSREISDQDQPNNKSKKFNQITKS